MTARDELPKLIEKGRQRVSSQVMTARFMGEYAVREGQKEAGKAVQQVASTLQELGVIPGRPEPEPEPDPVITVKAKETRPATNGKASTNGSAAQAAPRRSG